jgi:hypothetical protein
LYAGAGWKTVEIVQHNAAGERQPTLAKRLHSRITRWQRYGVTVWFGLSERLVEIVSETAIWHHPGSLVPIRYVLVRDVAEELKPQAFLCTSFDADPLDIIRWFVRRCRSRSPSLRSGVTSAWKPSGSGRTQPSHGPLRHFSGCCH